MFSTSLYLVYERYAPNRLSFNNYSPQKISNSFKQSSQPKYLIINDLGINVLIVPVGKVSNKWDTTTKGVSYLTNSPIPGATGNSIIYGHNWTSILGKLVNAKPGQEVDVIFEDGRLKRFKITYTQVVSPSEVSILNQTDDQRLTVYTCTGFLDSKRFVVTAIYQDPVEYSLSSR